MQRAIARYQVFLESIGKSFPRWTLCFVVAIGIETSIPSQAQTFTTLVNFDGINESNPTAGIVQGEDGNFYGTTDAGGITNTECLGTCGTVFQLTPSGVLTNLYDFCGQTSCSDGYLPLASLLLGLDGNFYGTSSMGGLNPGTGTVFRITNEGNLTTLYRFCSVQNCTDGNAPRIPLIEAPSGSLYGATTLGGVYGTYGNLFKIGLDGNFTNTFSFNNADGAYPTSLIQAPDGSFYGTTQQGGKGFGCFQVGCGTLFRISPGGQETVIHNFCSGSCFDGAGPRSLMIGTDGNLYGVAGGGGPNGPDGFGTIFRISPDRTMKIVYVFCSQTNCADGASPEVIIQGNDGNIYGTTMFGGDVSCNPDFGGCGTIFRLTTSGTLTTLHTFELEDGLYPDGLTEATSGVFYGTTVYGGSSSNCRNGCGTAFSLNVNLTPFVTFVLPAGKRGQTAGILGQGFTGTTAVTLNGTPMSFRVVSDTFIKARVPEGATTGYITVTTLSGTLTSNIPFQVIP